MKPRLARLAVGCMTLAIGLALPATVSAKAPVYSWGLTPLETQAGAHPDLVINFTLGTGSTQAPVPCGDCDGAKEITVESPPGLLGAPRDIPRCTLAQFSQGTCATDSQVGIVCLELNFPSNFCNVIPLYNMVPKVDQAALFAFPAPLPDGGGGAQLPIFTSFDVRTDSDYGLEAKVFGIPREAAGATLSPYNFTQILWGVPADPSHDALRIPPEGFGQVVEGNFPFKFPFYSCRGNPVPQLEAGEFPIPSCLNLKIAPPPTPSNVPATPFISNPTACVGPQTSTIETLAYDGETDHATDVFPAITGCDLLGFNPSQSIKPTTTAADSPSGAEFQLTNPQFESSTVPTQSSLREATVSLPQGFTVAPNLTNGKTICTDAEARIGSRKPAECPEDSKVATISVETPALPGELFGAAYLGESKPGDRYRMLLVFDGFGFHIKLPGSVILDRRTGQITLHFADLPQAPFARFTSHIFGSERGPLATPTDCGTYEVKSVFTPWDAALPDQTSNQFFTIDTGPDGSPCPGPLHRFSPGFQAGATDNTAGAHAPFSLEIDRADGEQNLTGLRIVTPPGFAATLKGVPYCPQAAIEQLESTSYSGLAELASSACPPASQVGTVSAGTGAGTHPLYVNGKAYLAGPYNGAPLSLLVVIPAVSGPYDLGNVAVRAAVHVDPLTAQVTTVSDPLPQIIEGIPLRARQIQINLDRKDFVLNPTNCEPSSVDATLTGDQGSIASPRSPFQVAGCADLPYEPKLQLRLTGGLRRLGHPAIHALFTAKPGEANTRRVSTLLPNGELLDNSHIGAVCPRSAFAAHACPSGSLVGSAEVTTPILDQPLRGSAYLRSSKQGLPDIALDLHGQFEIEAVARVDSVNSRYRATFESVPDVPLSSVSLNLLGGAKGLLQNSESLCPKPGSATSRMEGQNGARLTTRTKLQVDCGSKSRHKRHHRLHGRAGH
jgi:hypothetical protein